MSTNIAPTPDTSSLSLAQRIATFKGNINLFLLAALKRPDEPTTRLAESVGLVGDTPYAWFVRYPGLRELYEEIRAHAGDLRTEYAQAAMREAVPSLVDKMIAVGHTEGRDAQRARERILETVGVLPKAGDQLQQPPVQVVTHTYVLVQREPSAAGVTVLGVAEGEAKVLPPAAS